MIKIEMKTYADGSLLKNCLMHVSWYKWPQNVEKIVSFVPENKPQQMLHSMSTFS